jgi:flagellar hook-basal body complex protein FliE
MAVSFVSANAAYQAAQRVGEGAAKDTASALSNLAGPKSFETALNDALKNSVATMRVGEAAAAEGGAGKGDIVQVVNAVTAAELTLETVVAIRDRVISAYQDIMKMPI